MEVASTALRRFASGKLCEFCKSERNTRKNRQLAYCMTTVEHCDSLRAAALTPALICPIWMADSRPTTSNYCLLLELFVNNTSTSLSPISWTLDDKCPFDVDAKGMGNRLAPELFRLVPQRFDPDGTRLLIALNNVLYTSVNRCYIQQGDSL